MIRAVANVHLGLSKSLGLGAYCLVFSPTHLCLLTLGSRRAVLLLSTVVIAKWVFDAFTRSKVCADNHRIGMSHREL